jgi:glycosyltransferase involved in cell wall biosynthesis
VELKNDIDLRDKTIVYCLGIYINPGMRRLLIEYLKRASSRYRAIRVMFCYWWPGVDREPFVDMVNSLGIPNLRAVEFSIMASPSYGHKLGWPNANWRDAIAHTNREIGRMAHYLRENKADLAHIILTEYQASYAFALASKRAGVKSRLLSFTGVAPTPAKFRTLFNRITDRMLTGVLLASKADIAPARSYFPSTAMSVVYGWGLAPDLFSLMKVNPSKIRTELNLAPDTPLIGTTTRIAPNKGQDTLIDSLPRVVARLPNLRCAILGGRYDEDQGGKAMLEKKAKDLEIDSYVKFLGERNDTPDIFAAYDVAVHLPTYDYLPFGVLECMALGKPCLCTDVGGIPEIIKNGETGILVKPDDHGAVSDALISLLENPELRAKLGSSAQNLVLERYNLDNLVKRVERMYADSLNGLLKEVYG